MCDFRAHFKSHGLTKMEFKELLSAGAVWRTWGHEDCQRAPPRCTNTEDDYHVLTAQGLPVTAFCLLTRGRCEVLRGGVVCAVLRPGSLIGETSLVRMSDAATPGASNRPTTEDHLDSEKQWARCGNVEARRRATATVRASEACGRVEYVAWPIDGLAKHMSSNTHVKACLMTLIASAQATKLEAMTKEYSSAIGHQNDAEHLIAEELGS